MQKVLAAVRRLDPWYAVIGGLLCACVVWAVSDFLKLQEINSLLSANYHTQFAAHTRGSLDRGTLLIMKDGATYTCQNVHAENLRSREPITCMDGAVLTAK